MLRGKDRTREEFGEEAAAKFDAIWASLGGKGKAPPINLPPRMYAAAVEAGVPADRIRLAEPLRPD